MTKIAPEWVRTNDPVIRSPARYRWSTAPAPLALRDAMNTAICKCIELAIGMIGCATLWRFLPHKVFF